MKKAPTKYICNKDEKECGEKNTDSFYCVPNRSDCPIVSMTF